MFLWGGGAFPVSPMHDHLTYPQVPPYMSQAPLNVSLVLCTASLLVVPCDLLGHQPLSLWLPPVGDSPPSASPLPPPAQGCLFLNSRLGQKGERPPHRHIVCDPASPCAFRVYLCRTPYCVRPLLSPRQRARLPSGCFSSGLQSCPLAMGV